MKALLLIAVVFCVANADYACFQNDVDLQVRVGWKFVKKFRALADSMSGCPDPTSRVLTLTMGYPT